MEHFKKHVRWLAYKPGKWKAGIMDGFVYQRIRLGNFMTPVCIVKHWVK